MSPTRAVALALSAALASGCAAARMKIDPAVAASAEPWAVSGASPRTWRTPIAVGPYRTGPVKDAGTIGWSVEALGLGLAGTHRPVAWALAGGAGALDAECHERGLEAYTPAGLSVDAQGASGRPALACAFRAGEGARTWTLALRATGRPAPAFVGELRDAAGAAVYAIRSSHALEGSPLPLGTPAGFTLERDGAPALVIETLGGGRAWVAKAPGADRDALAAAAVALLLFQPEGP